MKKHYGIYAFDPTIDANQFAEDCRSWGINTAILHPGYFDTPIMETALRRNNIKIWLNLPIFFNAEFLQANPEYYSITSLGRKAIHDWSHFVCPMREDYLDHLIEQFTALAERLHPEIISLDFIRYFVFWELVKLDGSQAQIEDGCYCPVCLKAFEQVIGEEIQQSNAAEFINERARKAWGQWKTERINKVVRRFVDVLRKTSRDSEIWIKIVPWKTDDLDGAIHHVVGQDVSALGAIVDGIAPMAFTHLLNQTSDWKKELLAEVKAQSGKPVMSYLQVEKLFNKEEISAAQFEKELKSGLSEAYQGICIFNYEQLLENTQKIDILQRYLQDSTISD